MHISAISSDYSQIMRALIHHNSCGNSEQCTTQKTQSKQEDSLQKAQLYDAIVEWQRFCQQQILKPNLDVSA